MEYQILILSEQGLKKILSNGTALPTEDILEIRRALQFIADERTLKSNKVSEVKISKGFYAGKYI